MNQEPQSLRTCQICGAEFESRKERDRHIQSEHPEYFSECTKSAWALIALVILGAPLAILMGYFQNINPYIYWMLVASLCVETAIGFYVLHRVLIRLPQKYKRIYHHSGSQ